MKMENLNSGVNITQSDELFLGGRAGELTPLLFRMPVYWVSPDLMDRIYPPKRRRFLHPDCLREMLEVMEESEEINWEALLERIERCRDWSGGFVAVGLYLSHIGERTREIVREETGREIPERPSIFISPERVEKWAEEASSEIPFFEPDWGFRFFLAKVLVHELAHAYMDGGRNGGTFWERVIEESLANAFAYRSVAALASDAERMAFEKIVSQQPLEYQGWRYFSESGSVFGWSWLSGGSLLSLGQAWRRRSIPFIGPLAPLWIAGIPGIWFLPPHLRHRLAHILRWELPHPWDEFFYALLEEFPEGTRAGRFSWPQLALTILRALV